MGSAAEAPVVISSDDEDGAQTAAVGKRKSPEDAALAWAEGILDQDDYDEDDAVWEGVGYPAIMRELLDSLKDETGTVVGDKEGVVGGKNTSTVPDARDDDDDDCVILDGDPDKPVAVAKEEGAPPRDAAEDELQIVAEKGELACRDFPHPRHLCAALPFSTSSHASHCSMCHCYVCDCPAPCALWGNHCHATDQDARWKRLRLISKTKSQPNPKRRIPQHLNRTITTGPSSQYGRFPASGTSIMASQNMGRGITLTSAPSTMPRIEIPNYGSKGAQVGPPLYTSSNGNHLQPSVTSYGPVQPARPHASQTAQVSLGGHASAQTFQRYPPQYCVGAPMGSQGHQYRPPSYPQLAPNTVVGTGVPLSCSALLNAQAQGTQRQQVPSADTISKEPLANLARRLGLSDYSTNLPLGQQSTSTSQFQHMHPREILGTGSALHPREILLAQGAQNSTWQAHVKKSYVATTSQIVPSSGHNSSNHAPGGTVLSSGSVQVQQPLRQLKSSTVLSSGSAQIQQPLCPLKSQRSVTPSETAPNTLYVPQP